MEEELETAIESMGNVTGLFDPFRIIEMRGMDGVLVFDSIVSRIVFIGCGLLAVMCLFELNRRTVETTSSGKRPVAVLGFAVKAILAAGALLLYKPFVTSVCGIFPSIGERILVATATDINVQINSAFSTVALESVSQFKLWTINILDTTGSAVIAAICSFFALILMWVMSLLQGYLFAFWYLLGPLAIPCMVFPPAYHIMRNWMMSILGVSFWSVTGAMMVAICAKAQFLDKSYAAGSMGDFWVSIVFSLLCVVMMIATAGLADSLFSSLNLGLRQAYSSARAALPRFARPSAAPRKA